MRVCVCVCQRSRLVEVSYKGPPQLCRQTGNCLAFSVSCGSVCFFCSCMPFFLVLSYQPEAPCFSNRPPNTLHKFPHNNSSNHFFPYSPPSSAPFSLLAGPRVGLSNRPYRRWCSVTMVLGVFGESSCVWIPVYSASVVSLFS